jgi:hypothetical protein
MRGMCGMRFNLNLLLLASTSMILVACGFRCKLTTRGLRCVHTRSLCEQHRAYNGFTSIATGADFICSNSTLASGATHRSTQPLRDNVSTMYHVTAWLTVKVAESITSSLPVIAMSLSDMQADMHAFSGSSSDLFDVPDVHVPFGVFRMRYMGS